jgi:hypothetical protein
LPVTIPAGDGSGPAPLPPQLQMAAFTLTMQGILHIRAPRLGAEFMASQAFLTGCSCFQTLRRPWYS